MAARKSAGPRKAAAAKKAAPRRSQRFGAKGQRLWAAHSRQVAGERGLVLLEEACRIADRLDQLDALLKGEAEVWCRLTEDRTGDLEVRVDGALVEARQQASVLRQIIAGLPLREDSDGGDDDEGWIDNL